MKFSKGLFGTLLLAASLWQATAASAVDLGQIDTFEDGTTQNWIVGLLGAPSPVPPVNVPSGGPGGADDNYLLLTSIGGQGPGSKLVAINPAQWTGDYLAAGVQQIRMDVNNLGADDLYLRLLFENPMGGPPTDVAASTEAIYVPAGGGWTSVIFPILPSDLTALAGDVTTVLSNTTLLRLYNSPDLTFPGPGSISQLGVDNIQAAVPEPSLAAWLGVGTLALFWAAHRRK